MITRELTKEDIGKEIIYNKKTKGKIVNYDNKLRAVLIDFGGFLAWADKYYVTFIT